MAVEDAYGAKEWREGEPGAADEVAFRTEQITRSTCRAVAEYAFRTAAPDGRPRLRRPQVDGVPGLRGDAQGGDGRGRRPATRTIDYRPVLIDATYAGPAVRRDRRAARHPGAEPRRRLPVGPGAADVRLDRRRRVRAAGVRRATTTRPCAMAEAPHGTAPALQGKDLANPLAMILACGAVLRHARRPPRHRLRARLAGDLRGRAGDRRRRDQDARPRRRTPGRPSSRPRSCERVAHQARGVVLAGLLTSGRCRAGPGPSGPRAPSLLQDFAQPISGGQAAQPDP